MNTKLLKIYATILILLTMVVCVYANNEIDSFGGFVSLEPNGNTDADGWNLGIQYDGALSNAWHWYTATNYVATGGSGYLTLDNDNTGDTTTIYLGNNLTVGDEDPDYQGSILTGSLAGDLYIKTRNNVRLQVDDNAAEVINITGARNLYIDGGTYDSTRRQASNGEYAVSLTGITGNTVINDATFLGPDVNQNWVNAGGGVGLVINSGNNIILDNVTSTGGDGKALRRLRVDDSQPEQDNTTDTSNLSGGNGLEVQSSSASIIATNLIATAGNAGNYEISYLRVTNASYTASALGGNGINGGSELNISQGFISGGDGGGFTTASQDGDRFSVTFNANGGNGINGGTQSGILTNVTVNAGNGGEINIISLSPINAVFNGNGGSALTGNLGGGSLSGVFTAGDGASGVYIISDQSTLELSGGRSINNSSDDKVTIEDGTYLAGDGGTNVYVITELSQTSITSDGGIGLYGPAEIKNGIFTGGNGGAIDTKTATTSNIDVDGGASLYLTHTGSGASSSNIIHNGIFTGGNGGSASSTNGTSSAHGGDALTSIMTSNGLPVGDSTDGVLVINNGIFRGGNGGRSVSVNGSATAFAGGGASLVGGTNIINGGVFSSGNIGVMSSSEEFPSYSLLAANAHALSITNSIENKPLFDGDLILEDINDVNLQNGDVNGSIILLGSIPNLKINSNFNVDGYFQIGHSLFPSNATVNINISSESDGYALNNISMVNTCSLTFSNQTFKSDNNANISINELSQINFLNGAIFSSGSTIDVGLGTLNSEAGIVLDDNSSLNLNYNGSNNGTINISSGLLDLSASNAQLNLTGFPTNSNGSVNFGNLGDNSDTIDENKINTNFGWLLNTDITTQGNTSNALIVTYTYNLPTNHISVSDFQHSNHYQNVSAYIANTNFSSMNALGAIKGSAAIRYSELEAVNTSDGIYKDNQQINNLISARNTEFRSRHGFASSKHTFGKPSGVAGPESKKSQTEAWFRGYNIRGSYDETSSFDAHDIDGNGSVIGFDKYYNNILTGIAIGQSRSKSYSDSIYSSNSDIINGSIYSTIGGRKRYVDVALSFSDAETKVINYLDIPAHTINSSLSSYFIGTGQSFDLSKNIQITPEISYLYSKYEQDSYIRPGIFSKDVSSFSSSSKILSTGINIATRYQIDWFNKGLAMIPEFRLHWLREMNSNINDDINYLNNNTQGSLSVRPRDENLFKIGFGLNFWSWYSKNTRLELDYDLTTSDSYHEHLISGKVGIRF